jgi:hypothetical protein
MKPMSRPLYLVTLLVVFVPMAGSRAEAQSPDSRAQIGQLIARFKAAILAKDGTAMHGLFLPGGSWLQCLDKASLARVHAIHPEAKACASGSYEDFAKSVGTATTALEERFDHISIKSDGIVATVYFDYRFLVAGKLQNHGVETWQLADTGEGWKINGMLYSVIVDDFPQQ